MNWFDILKDRPMMPRSWKEQLNMDIETFVYENYIGFWKQLAEKFADSPFTPTMIRQLASTYSIYMPKFYQWLRDYRVASDNERLKNRILRHKEKLA